MELHTCRNCELIDEVITSKLQSFDILSQENISLHNSLIKARDKISTLLSEITHLNEAIFAERELNLQLYIKQNEKNRSNLLMNVVLNTNSKEQFSKQFSYSKKNSFKQTSDQNSISTNDYDKLINLIQEQRHTYQENLSSIQAVHEKYVTELEEQLEKTCEHTLVILDMYSLYRTLYFTQKKENCKDHKTFLETVDILANANNKHILELEQNVIETTTTSLNEQMRGVLNSFSIQMEKRDKLVSILRKQQTILDSQIDELQKKLEKQECDHNVTCDKLKKQLKREKEKYSALEQRRLFDFEGFSTDIKQYKKELARLKDISNKTELEQKMDKLYKKLCNSYNK